MKRFGKSVFVCLIVLFLGLPACGEGGGEVAEEVRREDGLLGLFDEPQVNLSSNTFSQDAMSGTQSFFDQMAQSMGGSSSSSEFMDQSNSEAIVKSVGLVVKQIESDGCQQVGETLLHCSFEEEVAAGGQVKTEGDVDVYFSEGSSVKAKLNFTMEFIAVVTLDSCNRHITANGFAKCSGNIYYSYQWGLNGSGLTFRFVGTCDTGNDPNQAIDLIIDDELHKLGFDLLVDSIQTNMDLEGTIFVDGVSYDVKDLKDSRIDQCG